MTARLEALARAQVDDCARRAHTHGLLPACIAACMHNCLQLLHAHVHARSCRILPGCQDTGTAIVVGKRGQFVFTDGADEEALSKGAYLAYTTDNLRYSQVPKP